MDRDQLMTALAQWVGDICETDAPALTAETDLVDDLGLDSLALAELAAKLRFKYKIKLRPGELQNELRVGPLVDLVLERLAEKG